MTMRFGWLAVLYTLVAPLVALCVITTAPSPRWDDMHMRYSWNITQVNWESLRSALTSIMIDLHVALKPGKRLY
ncbi:hypothetical protein EDB87DRAFT_1651783 [Lactarius vividus]|nr:hypothetical protein EDB87DRAFT_1651783 [Lactarius vividus]